MLRNEPLLSNISEQRNNSFKYLICHKLFATFQLSLIIISKTEMFTEISTHCKTCFLIMTKKFISTISELI